MKTLSKNDKLLFISWIINVCLFFLSVIFPASFLDSFFRLLFILTFLLIPLILMIIQMILYSIEKRMRINVCMIMPMLSNIMFIIITLFGNVFSLRYEGVIEMIVISCVFIIINLALVHNLFLEKEFQFKKYRLIGILNYLSIALFFVLAMFISLDFTTSV